jgi:hypothetical protein
MVLDTGEGGCVSALMLILHPLWVGAMALGSWYLPLGPGSSPLAGRAGLKPGPYISSPLTFWSADFLGVALASVKAVALRGSG